MSQSSTEDETESTEQPTLPFFDVGWRYGSEVRVRAGWTSDGDVESLAIDAVVPIEEASDQINTAYAWAARRWQELAERAAQAEPEAAPAET